MKAEVDLMEVLARVSKKPTHVAPVLRLEWKSRIYVK